MVLARRQFLSRTGVVPAAGAAAPTLLSGGEGKPESESNWGRARRQFALSEDTVAATAAAWRATVPTIPSCVGDGAWHTWLVARGKAGPTTASAMTPGDFKAFEHRWVLAEASPYATRHVRLTPSIRNTPAEVETALREVDALVQ